MVMFLYRGNQVLFQSLVALFKGNPNSQNNQNNQNNQNVQNNNEGIPGISRWDADFMEMDQLPWLEAATNNKKK